MQLRQCRISSLFCSRKQGGKVLDGLLFLLLFLCDWPPTLHILSFHIQLRGCVWRQFQLRLRAVSRSAELDAFDPCLPCVSVMISISQLTSTLCCAGLQADYHCGWLQKQRIRLVRCLVAVNELSEVSLSLSSSSSSSLLKCLLLLLWRVVLTCECLLTLRMPTDLDCAAPALVPSAEAM